MHAAEGLQESRFHSAGYRIHPASLLICIVKIFQFIIAFADRAVASAK
jgi:hypothetical protein